MKDYKGKCAFISHPFASDPINNKKKVDKICRYWVKQGVIPISPLHLFSFYDDDSNREDILNTCYKLINISDVVFIYGNSEGCKLERAYAEKKKKPVEIFFNDHKDINFISCEYLMKENKGVKL